MKVSDIKFLDDIMHGDCKLSVGYMGMMYDINEIKRVIVDGHVGFVIMADVPTSKVIPEKPPHSITIVEYNAKQVKKELI
jgi:hypothetical protein